MTRGLVSPLVDAKRCQGWIYFASGLKQKTHQLASGLEQKQLAFASGLKQFGIFASVNQSYKQNVQKRHHRKPGSMGSR